MRDICRLGSWKARGGTPAYVRVEWGPVFQLREGEQCLPDGAQSGLPEGWVNCMERCWYGCDPTHGELVKRLEQVALTAIAEMEAILLLGIVGCVIHRSRQRSH